MLRAILLALLCAEAQAQVSAGLATCLCITTMPDGVPRVACPDVAVGDLIGTVPSDHPAYATDNGKCITAVGLTSNYTDYPSTFGTSCKVWPDPGHQACYDLTLVPPQPKPTSEQADWCLRPWCYVDPCNCDASDATKSDYFPDTLFYSYGTCGEKNTYTALESATNTVGNAECATADESAGGGGASDANSLMVGLGSLSAVIVVMGTMA